MTGEDMIGEERTVEDRICQGIGHDRRREDSRGQDMIGKDMSVSESR